MFMDQKAPVSTFCFPPIIVNKLLFGTDLEMRISNYDLFIHNNKNVFNIHAN